MKEIEKAGESRGEKRKRKARNVYEEEERSGEKGGELFKKRGEVGDEGGRFGEGRRKGLARGEGEEGKVKLYK